MRKILLLLFSFFSFHLFSQGIWKSLPVYRISGETRAKQDWLIHGSQYKAAVFASMDKKDIILYNGLVKKVFRISPNLTCIDFKNMSTGEQLLRAIQPEAKITLNGKEYPVGGLHGQKEMAYLLPEWLKDMKSSKQDFEFTDFLIGPARPYLPWKSVGWVMNDRQASGVELTLHFHSELPELKKMLVSIHYVLYDGLPLLCKWVSILYSGDDQFTLDRVINEILAVPEEESAVVGSASQMKKPQGLYVETNYAFNNAMRYDLSDQTTHWMADSTYTSQVNYDFQTPCLLEVYAEKGPGIELRKTEEFQSIRTYELLMDSYDRERRGLAVRTMYSFIAPWTTENPIFMHLVSNTDDEVKNAVDQCAATGYESLILSFGSHCNMEDTSAANIQKWKSLAKYAHQRRIGIGAYSLFSSRTISDQDDVIDPKTGKPGGAFFGHAPCYGSKWGLAYLQKIKYFLSSCGFDLFENDGPYPGDLCASTSHPGHKGLDDSQWRQMELQKSLYHWCNQNGIYVNAPDWYFLDGTNKIALGYREVNFSLPREEQILLNRQNIYDGTWEKTPSMSWGFVPLTRYQGGGEEAVLEPLASHLKEYETLMMQYYGAGVQACYRGPRLYDSAQTRELVAKTISWYKRYRGILNSNIIHLRRADGRDWDGWLHVNPVGKTKGMLMLFNPLKTGITRLIKVPLYYTGLTHLATLREKGGAAVGYPIDRNYSITVPVTIGPASYDWYCIE
jgi:hypothetical protein